MKDVGDEMLDVVNTTFQTKPPDIVYHLPEIKVKWFLCKPQMRCFFT